MRHLLFTAAIFAATPALPDGINTAVEDPPVIAPAQDWSGPYAGLSYGRAEGQRTETRTTTRTEERCTKLGQPRRDCNDPIFLQFPDAKVVEVVTITDTVTGLFPFDADEIGAFAGYRRDFGRLVGGIEVNGSSSVRMIEAQLGLDAGRVLPFLSAGYGSIGDETGAVYGLGVDVLVGRHILLGVKGMTGDAGDVATLRLGWKF